MTHKFSQWWISASLTLFVVAFVLLVIIMRDQRKALTQLEASEGAGGSESTRSDQAGSTGTTTAQAAAAGTASRGQAAATAAADHHQAVVERGRIASLGGLTALIWLVILIFMVWQ
ncbi:MAG TPA: hypothetical protein VHT26_10085 [Trebonia sp.]|nr:hypothetical protein [Trebonia sp.]